MPNYLAQNATVLAPNPIAGNIPAQFQNARKKSFFDVITLTAELAPGDTIQFMKLPKGAMVISSVLDTTGLGGSCALSVGNQASADGLEAASANSLVLSTVVSAAARTNMTTETYKNKILLAEVQVQASVTAASSGGIGKQIAVRVDCLMPAGA